MGRDQEGETRHSKRDKQGVYHVVGDLILASKESQLSIYRLLKPIFMAAGSKPFLLITPFPRYMYQASNLRNTDFCELTPIAEGSLPACSGTPANPPYNSHPADLQEPAHPTST